MPLHNVDALLWGVCDGQGTNAGMDYIAQNRKVGRKNKIMAVQKRFEIEKLCNIAKKVTLGRINFQIESFTSRLHCPCKYSILKFPIEEVARTYCMGVSCAYDSCSKFRCIGVVDVVVNSIAAHVFLHTSKDSTSYIAKKLTCVCIRV